MVVSHFVCKRFVRPSVCQSFLKLSFPRFYSVNNQNIHKGLHSLPCTHSCSIFILTLPQSRAISVRVFWSAENASLSPSSSLSVKTIESLSILGVQKVGFRLKVHVADFLAACTGFSFRILLNVWINVFFHSV